MTIGNLQWRRVEEAQGSIYITAKPIFRKSFNSFAVRLQFSIPGRVVLPILEGYQRDLVASRKEFNQMINGESISLI